MYYMFESLEDWTEKVSVTEEMDDILKNLNIFTKSK